MKYSQFVLVIFLVFGQFIFYSCKHEPILSLDTPTVCFQDQVLPIINSSCAVSGCHDAGSEEPLTDYNTIMEFVTPFKPNSSKIFKMITTTSIFIEFMPPSPRSPLTQDQIDLINIWILQGAENNTCPEPPCDTANITFSGTIFPIIQNNCFGCHSGGNPGGGISLTNYNQVKTAGTITPGNPGSLLGAITFTNGNIPMPQNGNQLSECKMVQFRKWIDDGMPNN